MLPWTKSIRNDDNMPALLIIVTLLFLTCEAEARAPSAAVIVSTTTWHVGHDLTCTVTEGIDHERTLAIRDGARSLFRDADYRQFVSMFTTPCPRIQVDREHLHVLAVTVGIADGPLFQHCAS